MTTKKMVLENFDVFLEKVEKLEQENEALKSRLYMFDSMMALFNSGRYGNEAARPSLKIEGRNVGMSMLRFMNDSDVESRGTNES